MGLIVNHELIRVGDLVQYIDPVPEDLRILDAPGIVISAENNLRIKVKWLDTGAEVGMYFRRELKLLSRAKCAEKPPEKKL
tara:strand:+ start:250 stop:492 length:243 start_codon:yes stop_codon:yes gene_type:complete